MIVRSPLADLSLPNLDFSSFVLARGRRLPDKAALIDGVTGETLTFGEFTSRVDVLAGGLLGRGLRPGDVVAVCGPNSPAFALAAHAVWRAGAVVVTVNPLFTEREMLQELADAGARTLLVAPEALERALPAARQAGVADIISLGTAAGLSLDEAAGLPSLASVAAAAAPPPRPAVDPQRDAALILHSSGTTGLPKGVVLTHANLMAALYQLHSGDLAREDDVLIGLSPFFHVVGLNGVLNLGLSSLRSILCAAAPLGPELEQAAA